MTYHNLTTYYVDWDYFNENRNADVPNTVEK